MNLTNIFLIVGLLAGITGAITSIIFWILSRLGRISAKRRYLLLEHRTNDLEKNSYYLGIAFEESNSQIKRR